MTSRFSFLGYATIMVIFFLMMLFSDLPLYSVLGITLFLVAAFKFFDDLGKRVDVRDLMIVIALLQWIVGPVLTYQYYADDQFYYMAVSQEEYMGYVFPAAIGLMIGLYLPIWRKVQKDAVLLTRTREIIRKYPDIDIWFVIIGAIAELLVDYVPLSFDFFFVLLGSFRFIGIYFITLNPNRPYKWWLIGIIIAWLFLKSINDAMFHDLLLWFGFMLMLFAFMNNFSLLRKATFVGLLVFMVVIIQAVKHEFRKTAFDEGVSRGTVFTNLVQNRLSNFGVVTSDANVKATVNRINQGWIVARIMSHTPRVEPFADGETIIAGVKAALVPRLLDPNKIVAGGRTYFERFTGKPINNSTSMGLSPLGEAYANFGVNGGIFFMFCLGLFYNFFIHRIYVFAVKRPSLILWFPLMFLQVVKAETDFAVVFNHLIKATFVVVATYIVLRNIVGIKL